MKDRNLSNEQGGAEISRRALVAGVVAVSASGVSQMAKADEPKKSDLEIANETLVNDFCRDWALRDVEKLRPYLAEDLYHQQAPGRPVMESREEFEKQMGGWLKTLELVEFKIVRSHVIGPIVLNERVDRFKAPAGSKGPSMQFHVVGEFFIENGVIKVWKDWPMPGSKPIFG